MPSRTKQLGAFYQANFLEVSDELLRMQRARDPFVLKSFYRASRLFPISARNFPEFLDALLHDLSHERNPLVQEQIVRLLRRKVIIFLRGDDAYQRRKVGGLKPSHYQAILGVLEAQAKLPGRMNELEKTLSLSSFRLMHVDSNAPPSELFDFILKRAAQTLASADGEHIFHLAEYANYIAELHTHLISYNFIAFDTALLRLPRKELPPKFARQRRDWDYSIPPEAVRMQHSIDGYNTNLNNLKTLALEGLEVVHQYREHRDVYPRIYNIFGIALSEKDSNWRQLGLVAQSPHCNLDTSSRILAVMMPVRLLLQDRLYNLFPASRPEVLRPNRHNAVPGGIDNTH